MSTFDARRGNCLNHSILIVSYTHIQFIRIQLENDEPLYQLYKVQSCWDRVRD